jgi:GntR family transcriptional regulator, transcriptional repressor for pyruvate dehydrogenase complex
MASRRTAFRPLRPLKSLTGELVERLTEEITKGRLTPGDKLPTEAEMIRSFGVSRTVVREAIASLRAVGMVDSRQGSGVYVARDLMARPFLIDPNGLISIAGAVQVMELRMSVEIEAAGLAAQRRTEVQRARIERTLGAFDRAVAKGDAAVDADFAFHCAIAEATGNPYFARFLEFLGRYIIPRQSIRVGMWDEDKQHDYLKGVLGEHQQIAAAISRQDPPAAREAMRLHLERGRERYRRIAQEAGIS